MGVEMRRAHLLLAVLAALVTGIGTAAAQSEQVDPFLISGALGLEAEIEACAIPATPAEREQLAQAIRTFQKRAKLPDEFFVKVRRGLREAKKDPDWKEVQVEVCKDMREKYKQYLAEVVAKAK
jgi:hypothetical protein